MIDWKMLIPVLICGIALGYHLGTTITQREVEELKEQHFHLLAEIQQKTGEEYAALADKLQEREKALGTALLPWLILCVLMLAGCASRPTERVSVSVPCPEPMALPASVTESASPDALAFSAKVQDWLVRVRQFLLELPQTKTSSE